MAESRVSFPATTWLLPAPVCRCCFKSSCLRLRVCPARRMDQGHTQATFELAADMVWRSLKMGKIQILRSSFASRSRNICVHISAKTNLFCWQVRWVPRLECRLRAFVPICSTPNPGARQRLASQPCTLHMRMVWNLVFNRNGELRALVPPLIEMECNPREQGLPRM